MESPVVARDYSYMDDHVSSDTEQMTLPAETNPMGSQANMIWGSIIDAVATMGIKSVNESVRRSDLDIGRFYRAYREDQLRRSPHYNGVYEEEKYRSYYRYPFNKYQSGAWNNHKPGSTEWKNQKKWQQSRYKERKKRIKERRKYNKKYQRYREKNKTEHYRVWKEEQSKRDFEEYISMST
ncbi:MAG: hypothetical protein GY694_21935 [Gammaproteobacteria bacterium]|nr:hypothetical protein [Gammaproteobacteria bacterium]